MKNTLKRTLCMLLAFVMAFSLAGPAYAAGLTTGEADLTVEQPSVQPKDEIISDGEPIPVAEPEQPGNPAEEPATEPVELPGASKLITDMTEEGKIEGSFESREDPFGAEDIPLTEPEDLFAEKTFTFSDENGFAVEVFAPEGALPNGTEMHVARLTDLAPVQNVVDWAVNLSGKVELAADISFTLDGKEIEPAQGAKLVVRMSAPEIEGIAAPVVIHIPDGEYAVPEIMEQMSTGDVLMANTVSFEASDFSVYAVIDVPFEDNRRVTINFYKEKGGEPLATVYVKEGDELLGNGEREEGKSYIDDIVYDPGVGSLESNQLFKGWCRLDGEDDVINESTPILDIAAVRKQIDQIDITAITDDEDVVVNYYAVIYKFFDVSYYDGDICYGSQTLTMPLSTMTQNYTVSMAYVAGGEQNFEGWLVEDGLSNINSAELPDGTKYDNTDESTDNDLPATKVLPNDTKLVIKGDVKFNVKAPKGHWLVFHENPHTADNTDGNLYKGATYIAPQFLLPDDPTEDPNGDDGITMKLAGYSFDGWYTGTESNGVVTLGTKFTFGDTIAETTHLYAKWIPNTTAYYTLIVWKQNAKLDGYDFESTEQVTGAPGETISYDGASHSYTGFEYDHSDISAANKNEKIAANNSVVVNVFYNRKEYTLTFKTNNGGYPVITYKTVSNYDLVRVETRNSTAYAIKIGDKWYQITRYGSYVWDAVSINKAPSPGSNINYSYYDWGSLQTYEDAPVSTSEYTIPTDPSVIKTITAKYGTDISSNFPIKKGNDDYTGYVWTPQDSAIFTTGDVPTLQIMPAENTVFVAERYGTSNLAHLYYYLEVTPDDPHTGTGYVQRDGKWYKEYQHVQISIGYGGISSTKSEDFYDLNGFTQLASDPAYGSNGTVELSSSNQYTIKFYYSRDQYQIQYLEGSYFGGKAGNEPMDVASDRSYDPSNKIYYDADISGYGNKDNMTSDPKTVGYFVPEAPDGYVFGGWCVDKSCTSEYSFEKMPQGNLTVYAKWIQIRYRVFLHPNAGTQEESPTLTWGSSDQQMSFGVAYGDKISAPYGIRDGYEFIGWFKADGKVFNSDFIALTDLTVPENPEYNKETDYTDTIDKWGTVGNPKSNSDVGRFWVTRKLDLYGKWRKAIPGASGINVIYDLNGGSGDVVDNSKYLDNVEAIAQGASTAPDPSKDHFLYWVVQKWDKDYENEDGSKGAFVDATKDNGDLITAFPGDSFTIHADDAKVVILEKQNKQARDADNNLVWLKDEDGNLIKDDDGNPIPVYEQEKDEEGNPVTDEDGNPVYVQEITKATYTIQLRAEYGPLEAPTPTHVYWYANNETDDVQRDENIQINKGIAIPTQETWVATETQPSAGTDGAGDATRDGETPTASGLVYDGHVFLGWARLDLELDDNGNPVYEDGKPVYEGLQPEDITSETEPFLKWVEAADVEVNGVTSTVDAHFEAKNDDGEWVTVTQVACDEKQPYNDLYAIWGQAFYVYHSGDNKVERVLMDKTFSTVDLTQFVDTNKYLYGGYYKDYAGKSTNFSVDTLTWKQAEAVSATASDGPVQLTRAKADDTGSDKKPYTLANIGSITWGGTEATKAYTDRADKLAPVADTVYYIKEVPIDSYLLPKLKFTYKSSGGKDFGTAWVMSDVDDLNGYLDFGFRIGTELYKGAKAESLTITPIHDESKVSTVTVNNFGNNITGGITYLVVYNNPEGGMNNPGDDQSKPYDLFQLASEDGKMRTAEISQFWITPDGMLVTGKMVRTYLFTMKDETSGIILYNPAPQVSKVESHTSSEIIPEYSSLTEAATSLQRADSETTDEQP